ncbi:hypothetical protein A0J61_11948, partial [Choanephora cucurbitarum]
RYPESLYRTVHKMDDAVMERWYDENHGDRIFDSSFSGYFKVKALQVAKLYITGKTNWNLAGDDFKDQAEVMYQNTGFLARGFCVRHFKQKKDTDFLFSQLSRRDSDHSARQLNYAVMKSLKETDENDMANAILPLHMAMDSWLAQAILSSIHRGKRDVSGAYPDVHTAHPKRMCILAPYIVESLHGTHPKCAPDMFSVYDTCFFTALRF